VVVNFVQQLEFVTFVLYYNITLTVQMTKRLVCVYTATVAVVKSRDMHWGLLAQKDHKDVNLSTLRMLLVADGANPCQSLVIIHSHQLLVRLLMKSLIALMLTYDLDLQSSMICGRDPYACKNSKVNWFK